ncbi:MAG: hypothetical protein L3J18_15930 [Candidatus Brocadia sp.]|uniref:Reverse transcriptase (RNA-dependent DNA polymerase) n=1 Tax=Candidatus Brocadia fulgida TaxID=380242 RepID=A0A0M2UZ69_9BACT|nr:MAG: Reverse transcriptase (RNA-dependent DNA polymerase) [Candidatus Brocadia fulgida]UJS20361.1 MAG: hypothetical protein L3J18_15930 [Candidatus Brocadia sp.]
MWLSKHYPKASFVRYADDVVVHCTSKAEAERVLETIKERLAEVKLKIKEEKIRIAYCSDYRRKGSHEVVKFEFLGFSYQPGARKSIKDGKQYKAFAAEISQSNQKRIREVIREMRLWSNTVVEVSSIAKLPNAKLRGWIAYYGKYSIRSLRNTLLMIDRRLIKWLRKKHKIGYRKSVAKLNLIKQANPELFYHWKMGYC